MVPFGAFEAVLAISRAHAFPSRGPDHHLMRIALVIPCFHELGDIGNRRVLVALDLLVKEVVLPLDALGTMGAGGSRHLENLRIEQMTASRASPCRHHVRMRTNGLEGLLVILVVRPP